MTSPSHGRLTRQSVNSNSRQQAAKVDNVDGLTADASGAIGFPDLGCLVYVRYTDHVLFRDVDPETIRPFTRESVGWLDYVDSDCVRVVWERFSMPDPPNESKTKATGLAILRKTILEIRKIA